MQTFLRGISCDVTCLTEHWMSEDQLKLFSMEEFDLISYFCRDVGKHGGSAIYASRRHLARPLIEINTMSKVFVFECCAVEFLVGDDRVIVLCVYRPSSSDVMEFISSLEAVLAKLQKMNCILFIAGDFNIDILEPGTSLNYFIDILDFYSIKIPIREPTRISSTSASCIDNILVSCNIFDRIVEANVLPTGYSDHFAQFLVCNIFVTHTPNHSVFVRQYKQSNLSGFCDAISDETWHTVYGSTDSDLKFASFMDTFMWYFNNSFPKLKTKTVKRRALLSSDIVASKNNVVLYQMLSLHNPEVLPIYRLHQRKHKTLLQETKRNYYSSRIVNADNKSREMWKIINTNLNSHRQQVLPNTSDKHSLANRFNDLFANSNLCFSSVKNSNTLRQIVPNPDTFFLLPATSAEVISCVGSFKNKRSCGIDEVPVHVVKACIKNIAQPLCHVINSCFTDGVYPSKLKIALVKPLFKKGDPNNLDNYRPISLLSVFNKIFEYLLFNRLNIFLTKSNIFNKFQHGFTKGKSIETALFLYTDRILSILEQRKLACGIFLDLSKAFDSVNHNLLLTKLELYGVRGVASELLSSYLSNRQQIVSISCNGRTACSRPRSIVKGIPQGSVLGPLLFNIYLNDIYSAVCDTHHLLINYADDTNLLVCGDDLLHLTSECRDCLDAMGSWFEANELILNDSKTACLIFKTNNCASVPSNLVLNGRTYNSARYTKFLGIYIDEYLNWRTHVEFLAKQLNSLSYGIRHLQSVVDFASMMTIYYGLFHARMKYGIVMWGRSSDMDRIFIAQKRIIRLIFGLGFNQSCRTTFRNNNILTVYAVYIYECIIFLTKNEHYFQMCRTTHQYNTRLRDINFSFPIHRLALTEKGPYYSCLQIYNKLPIFIKSTQSLGLLKHRLYCFLVNLEPYSLNDFFSL